MQLMEMIQTTNALAGLAVLLYVAFRLKRALKTYAKFGVFH